MSSSLQSQDVKSKRDAFFPQMYRFQHKGIRYTKKQWNMAYTKEQDKSTETSLKETGIWINWQRIQNNYHKGVQWAQENDAWTKWK